MRTKKLKGKINTKKINPRKKKKIRSRRNYKYKKRTQKGGTEFNRLPDIPNPYKNIAQEIMNLLH